MVAVAAMITTGMIQAIWMTSTTTHVSTPTKMESRLKRRDCLLELLAASKSPRSLWPRDWEDERERKRKGGRVRGGRKREIMI